VYRVGFTILREVMSVRKYPNFLLRTKTRVILLCGTSTLCTVFLETWYKLPMRNGTELGILWRDTRLTLQLISKTWMPVVNFMVMVTIVHCWLIAVYWLKCQWSRLVYAKLSKLYNDTPRHMIQINRFTSSQSDKQSHGNFCCTFLFKKIPPSSSSIGTSC
jgi:hypothetical protein